jgi:CheY-like chemotaxis protein
MNPSAPILLVEDDENDVLLTQLAFRTAGMSNPLQVAHSGYEAILYLGGDGIYVDRTRYPIPDLMLLDLSMPVLTGFDVLEWLRGHPPTSEVVVIVLTASSNPADIERAMALGAADYRVKPSNSAHLVQILRELRARWLGPARIHAPTTGVLPDVPEVRP